MFKGLEVWECVGGEGHARGGSGGGGGPRACPNFLILVVACLCPIKVLAYILCSRS